MFASFTLSSSRRHLAATTLFVCAALASSSVAKNTTLAGPAPHDHLELSLVLIPAMYAIVHRGSARTEAERA